MRGLILFAALLAALSVTSDLVDGQNSYRQALMHGRPQHQDRYSRSPQLQRSHSEERVNRNPNYGGRSTGRSQSLDHGGGHNDGSCSKNYHMDYLRLALQWGPGFCATSPKHCVLNVSSFTIHGLWPKVRGSYSGHGVDPEFCCFDNTFYFKEIEPLVPTLNKYWFSYYSKNSKGFWSHEWIKHGTCFRDVAKLQGEQKYFGNTLEIMKRLDILGALKRNGIVPGPSKVYSAQSILNAMRNLTGGKSVQVDCDLEAHQPTPILTGMNVCLDTNLAFVDCPPGKSRCSRDLMFVDR